MPRPNLKALRKPVSRYNNSSPRYTRENHYAILAQKKISQVFKLQDKHNASYFSKMSWSDLRHSECKIKEILFKYNKRRLILSEAR